MKLRTLIAATLIAAGPIAVTAPAAYADKDPIYTGRFSNVALQGYDTVAYFTDGEATKGDADFKTTHEGAEFRFASQENLDLFLEDPAKYTPQYGGYCAWAVSQGYTAKGDARRWAMSMANSISTITKKFNAIGMQTVPVSFPALTRIGQLC